MVRNAYLLRNQMWNGRSRKGVKEDDPSRLFPRTMVRVPVHISHAGTIKIFMV